MTLTGFEMILSPTFMPFKERASSLTHLAISLLSPLMEALTCSLHLVNLSWQMSSHLSSESNKMGNIIKVGMRDRERWFSNVNLIPGHIAELILQLASPLVPRRGLGTRPQFPQATVHVPQHISYPCRGAIIPTLYRRQSTEVFLKKVVLPALPLPSTHSLLSQLFRTAQKSSSRLDHTHPQ